MIDQLFRDEYKAAYQAAVDEATKAGASEMPPAVTHLTLFGTPMTITVTQATEHIDTVLVKCERVPEWRYEKGERVPPKREVAVGGEAGQDGYTAVETGSDRILHAIKYLLFKPTAEERAAAEAKKVAYLAKMRQQLGGFDAAASTVILAVTKKHPGYSFVPGKRWNGAAVDVIGRLGPAVFEVDEKTWASLEALVTLTGGLFQGMREDRKPHGPLPKQALNLAIEMRSTGLGELINRVWDAIVEMGKVRETLIPTMTGYVIEQIYFCGRELRQLKASAANAERVKAEKAANGDAVETAVPSNGKKRKKNRKGAGAAVVAEAPQEEAAAQTTPEDAELQPKPGTDVNAADPSVEGIEEDDESADETLGETGNQQ